MSTYDPAVHGTYGQWLRDKGLQVKGDRTVPRSRETRDEHGRIVRSVTRMTDSGAITTDRDRTDERGGTHRDVHVHMPTIRGAAEVLRP